MGFRINTNVSSIAAQRSLTVNNRSAQNTKTKHLTGAKGPESCKLVKEELKNEVNIKLGCEMAHVVLHEEELVLPTLETRAPVTTTAQIQATTTPDQRKSRKPKGQLKKKQTSHCLSNKEQSKQRRKRRLKQTKANCAE